MTSAEFGRITHAARRSVVVLVMVVAVLGVGPGGAVAGAKTSPSTTPTTAPTPKRWDPRIAPIAKQVEKLRKLKFEHPVAVTFLSDAAFEKKVAVDKGKLTKDDKRDAERAQSQLRAVGLIGADVDLL